MVSFGSDASCRDAELHYYQYLCDPDDASIPSDIAYHIRRCPYCRSQIDQLKATLDDVSPHDQASGTQTDIVGALTLHFSHVGEEVGCVKARSFLPVLLIPSLKIRIPTPITAHLDDCPRCRQDMEALAGLGLSDEQLARLSRLYAAGIPDDPALCRRIRPKIHADGPAWFEDADPHMRDHVCTCPRCRSRVYRRRERIRPGGEELAIDSSAIRCDDLSTSDLFDCVAPYGLPDGPSAAAREAIRTHLQTCPDCAERMQELHRVVYGIAERIDSGVVTVYTTADLRPPAFEPAGDAHEAYQVRVDVRHPEPAPATGRLPSIVRLPATMWSKVTNRQFRPALAAAAMVLIGVAIFVNTQTASALRLSGIVQAVRNVESVHVTQYAGDSPVPAQELWIVRTPKLVLLKTATEEARFDLNRGQKTIHPARGTGESNRLEPQERENVERIVDDTLGYVLTDVPANKEMQRVMTDTPETSDGGETYELVWDARTSGGRAVPHRLRVVLDPTTKLPSKTMLFQSASGDDGEWELAETRVFDYPGPQATDLVMKEMPTAR